MSTPSNLSEQIIAAPSGAGEVRALGETFVPDPHTGTGRYVIPIPLRPGPAGIVPSLALAYSTAGGAGAAGVGWHLDVASVERRIGKGVPTYDDGRDRFALQGDELVAQGGGFYRFRIERRFAKIRRLAGAGQDGWTVAEKDGSTAFYGETPESRWSDGHGRTAAWHLTRTRDVHGNEIRCRYERDAVTTEVRLIAIEWAGCYQVQIAWEPRPDPIASSLAGFRSEARSRIASIEIQVTRSDANTPATYLRYALSYALSRWSGRSQLQQVIATGIDEDGAEQSFPPLTFEYGDADLAGTRWHEVTGDRPGDPLSSRNVTLLKQSGSGLLDILETRGTGHFLRVNTGAGHFAQARPVRAPAQALLAEPGAFLSDMDGDGYADLVLHGGRRVYRAAPGAGGWGGSYSSAHQPSVALDAPDVRLADLTGNGLPDALRSGAGGWTFFENLGDGRWAPPVSVIAAPPVSLADPRVHLADVDGDGLADLVHVDATGITVWPSLARGRFGAPHRLAGAPRFGWDFDPARVRFADLTGSGQADLVYTRAGVVEVAFNQAGIGFAPLVEVSRGALSSRGHVEPCDLLGTGAEGLLYTDVGGAWRFHELFTAGPLDLLRAVENGLGARTEITYGTSGRHWAQGLSAGRPWRTRVPITTVVVDRMTTTDSTTGTTLEVSFRYAHGVYDGREREFRGFARVEQFDREAPGDDPAPIAQARTVSWFHVGDHLDVVDEWYPVPGPPLADDIPDHPWARRASAALVRREETYGLDDPARPYQVIETAYRAYPVGTPTARDESAWAPVTIVTRRTILERSDEARQTETFTTYDLDLDPAAGYGLPLEVREIGHGRVGGGATPHEQQQRETLERVTRTTYLHRDRSADDDPDPETAPPYLVGIPSDRRELAVTSDGEILLARTRWFYDGEPFAGLGYPGSGTTPAVTKGRLSAQLEWAFSRATFEAAYGPSDDAASIRDQLGGYLADGDDYYAHAFRGEYSERGMLVRTRDARGGDSCIEYDPRHELFVVRVTDALGHPTQLERGRLPFQLSALVDSNGNRTQFTYEPTGLPRTRAVMGKLVSGEWQGDPPEYPTNTFIYDFEVRPVCVTTRTRQVRGGATADVHRYVDGLGRVVQERHLAEPDPAAPAMPRFRVSGWQIFNHKGLIVRQFQPVFSSSVEYAAGAATAAVTATRYDPLGRVDRVTHPDGTFASILRHPWIVTQADRNDNAAHLTPEDPRYGALLSAFAPHVDTPLRVYLDALGRQLASAADNGGGAIQVTRQVFDLKDRVVEVWDARGLARPTWIFAYDGLGRRIASHHTTGAGARLLLPDVAGNPVWSRDANGVSIVRTFDALNRPLTETSREAGVERLRRYFQYPVYDPLTSDFMVHRSANRMGRLEESRDSDGLRFYSYDWRGLPVRVTHRFWAHFDAAGRAWHDAASAIWSTAASQPGISGEPHDPSQFLLLPGLDDESGLTIDTAYDAAGRPLEVRYPGDLHVRSTFTVAGAVERIELDRDGSGRFMPIVGGCAYDAFGQITSVTHGNGVTTTGEYDTALRRLMRLTSTRPATADRARIDFQDLAYAYDPQGHVLTITDNLAASSFSHNRMVPNTRTFRHDARYRLIDATGKRHRTAASVTPDIVDPIPDPNDYEPYRIAYEYDAVGNADRNEEYAPGGLRYKAGLPDLFNGHAGEAGTFDAPGDGNFRYDANGNTTRTPRHRQLAYSHDEQLSYVDLGGGGQVRYYRHGDQRTLRLVRKNGVASLAVYLGPFEYHERLGSRSYAKVVLHVNGHGRHAQVERILTGADADSVPLFFHHGDHLASGHVLTTESGDLLSQEEYFAYGRASDRRDARNRYRFIGVERDEDTGLCMTGPRAYDPVIGRFLQPDPLASRDATVGPYVYARCAPLDRMDPGGYADKTNKTVNLDAVPDAPAQGAPPAGPELNPSALGIGESGSLPHISQDGLGSGGGVVTPPEPPPVVGPDGFTMSRSQMREYVTTVAERFPDDVAAQIDVEGRWQMMDGPPEYLEGNRVRWAISNGDDMAGHHEQALRMREYAAMFPSDDKLADELAGAADEIIQDVSRATQIYRTAAAAGNVIGRIALQSAAQSGLEMAGIALADVLVPGAGAVIEGGAALYGGAETVWALGPIAVPAATSAIMLTYTFTHLDDPEYMQQMSRIRWR